MFFKMDSLSVLDFFGISIFQPFGLLGLDESAGLQPANLRQVEFLKSPKILVLRLPGPNNLQTFHQSWLSTSITEMVIRK